MSTPAVPPAVREYASLRQGWPERDTLLGVFRYLLAARFAGGARVLDLGCGAGEGALLVAPVADEYIGVDLQPWWQQEHIALPPSARLITADACALPGDMKGRFDLVLAFELIEHVAAPDELLASIREALAPGGSALVTTPNRRLHSAGPSDDARPLFEHHVREYLADEFAALLKSAGMPACLLGLSQLSGGARPIFAAGRSEVQLAVGQSCPDVRIVRAGRIIGRMAPEDAQSLFGLLGPASRRGLLPGRAGLSRLTPARAAALAAQWILMRRNEHVRELQEVVANRTTHVKELAEIVADREKHACVLADMLAALERQTVTLEDAIRTRQGEIDDLRGIVSECEARIAALQAHIERLETGTSAQETSTTAANEGASCT